MTLEEASSKNKLTLNGYVVNHYDLRRNNCRGHLTLFSFTIRCNSTSYKVSTFKQLDNSTRIKVSAEELESFDYLKSKYNLRLIREYRLSFRYIYMILYTNVHKSSIYRLILEREEKNNAEKN